MLNSKAHLRATVHRDEVPGKVRGAGGNLKGGALLVRFVPCQEEAADSQPSSLSREDTVRSSHLQAGNAGLLRNHISPLLDLELQPSQL